MSEWRISWVSSSHKSVSVEPAFHRIFPHHLFLLSLPPPTGTCPPPQVTPLSPFTQPLAFLCSFLSVCFHPKILRSLPSPRLSYSFFPLSLSVFFSFSFLNTSHSPPPPRTFSSLRFLHYTLPFLPPYHRTNLPPPPLSYLNLFSLLFSYPRASSPSSPSPLFPCKTNEGKSSTVIV
jgi:hypothetical protein